MEILGKGWDNVSTVEGQVVKIADMVAYINHDVEDAIRGDIISQRDLPDSTIKILGDTNSRRINSLVTDIVKVSLAKMEQGVKNNPLISMSTEVLKSANELRDFLFEKVYYPSLSGKDVIKARQTMLFLFNYFINNNQELPQEYNLQDGSIERKVADYIAGMTDHYALSTAEKLYIK
jgi:dGTPase